MPRYVIAVVTLVLALGIGMVTASMAQSPGQGASHGDSRGGYDDWNVMLEFHNWLTAISGDVTSGGNRTSIDISFRDTLHLLDELQFGIMAHGEVKKGPFGLLLDGMYMRMEDRGGGVFAVPVFVPSFGQTVPIPVQVRAEVLAEAAITEGALAYDIWASSNWRGGWPTMRVEALAGARYTYLRTKIDAAFTSALGNVRVESDGHEDWVDPFVGGRFSWHPADRCLLSLRTDFGGFTAGADFAWNVNLAVAYKLTNWLTVDGGYRALYTDLDKGDFKYRLWWHGPWMGLGVRF